eukprot:12751164-Heterocapsa_arctica.AAC.1
MGHHNAKVLEDPLLQDDNSVVLIALAADSSIARVRRKEGATVAGQAVPIAVTSTGGDIHTAKHNA